MMLKPRLKARIIFLFIVVLTNGCAGRFIYSLDDSRITPRIEESRIAQVGFEEQAAPYSCGLAALVSVLKYWEIEADQRTLLEEHPPKTVESGYTIGELKEIAVLEGAHAFSFKADTAFLVKQLELGRPVIVPVVMRARSPKWEQVPVIGLSYRIVTSVFSRKVNHFLVICGLTEDGFWVMDPKLGFMEYTQNELEKMRTGMDFACLLAAS